MRSTHQGLLMNQSKLTSLSPESIQANYKKPGCRKTYCCQTTFPDDSDFFECEVLININPKVKCCSPRWCHHIPRSELEKEPKEQISYVRDFYCGLTQEEIIKRYPDRYETTNGICALCLQRGICCYFIDHRHSDQISI